MYYISINIKWMGKDLRTFQGCLQEKVKVNCDGRGANIWQAVMRKNKWTSAPFQFLAQLDTGPVVGCSPIYQHACPNIQANSKLVYFFRLQFIW